MATNRVPTYDVSVMPRGYGVIIVNKFEKFENFRREGAEKEIENLSNLVTSLGLILTMSQDLTREGIVLFLEDISKRHDLENNSMIFIAIWSVASTVKSR